MKTHKNLKNIQNQYSLVQESAPATAEEEKKGVDRTDLFREYPDVVGVDQLCVMLGGISRKLATRLLRERKIPYIRIGREYKVAKPDVIAYVLNQPIDDEFFKLGL